MLDVIVIGAGPAPAARAREVVNDVRVHSALRGQIDSLGMAVYE
jgi:hypothetical protein